MTRISKEYAEALFAVAKESDNTSEVLQGLKSVAEVFRANPEYIEFLSLPSIPRAERAKAVSEALADKVSRDVEVFVCLLCERGAIREFYNCVEVFEAFYMAERNIAVAEVESAVELTQSESDILKKRLEKKIGRTVELKCRVNPELLGGIRVTIDGNVMDGSIIRKLHEVKEVIDR